MDLCRFLRWKGWYGARFRSQADLDQALLTSDSQFSCLKTCRSWGPDDQLVRPEGCGSSRACFERSPKTPRVFG
jgi:hypothetical protein